MTDPMESAIRAYLSLGGDPSILKDILERKNLTEEDYEFLEDLNIRWEK